MKMNDDATSLTVHVSPSQSANFKADDMSLDRLPPEILLHVCSFLDTKFVVNVFANVSQIFWELIMDNTFWKSRLRKRWPKKYPAVSGCFLVPFSSIWEHYV